MRSARTAAAPAIITAGAAVVIAGTFWPWVASGSANRNSYELLDVVRRLGFAPDGPLGWGVRLWPLVPLLMVATTVAAWSGRRAIAVGLGLAGSLYAGGVGVAIDMAPRSGLVRVLGAPLVTAVAAAVVLAGVLVEAVLLVRSRRSVRGTWRQRARATRPSSHTGSGDSYTEPSAPNTR